MIKIYSKPNCPKCETVKEYVKGANIEHEVIDATSSPELLGFLRDIAEGAGFPVVKFLDNSFIAGNVEKILEKLSESVKVEEIKSSNQDYFWGK